MDVGWSALRLRVVNRVFGVRRIRRMQSPRSPQVMGFLGLKAARAYRLRAEDSDPKP